ncbi:MAG: fluoride efflux transporter CrcB [Solirubrobacteraceae bacterium]
MSAWTWLAVGSVGGLGALARFVLDSALAERPGRGFPYGTFTINLTGSLALGVMSGLAVGGTLLVIAGGALIGSYTTFSTWMFETHRLAEDGELRRAANNILLSLLCGLAAVAVGHVVGAGL